MEAAEGTKSSYEKPNPRKSWTGGSKWISKLSQSFEAVQYKAIKNTMHHLLKNNRLHHIAISLQSSKGLEPVSSTYNRTKNKLQMFATCWSSIWPNLILILLRSLTKQSKLYILIYSNVYQDATDFEACKLIKHTKNQIS